MEKTLKIGFVTPYLSTGGAERAFLNIANAFFEKGIDVQIVAASVVETTLAQLPDGMKLIDLQHANPLDSPSFIKNTKALKRYLTAEKPDAVISTSDYLNVSLIAARFLSGSSCKIIVSQQVHVGSYLKELPRLNRMLIQFLQSIVARKADAIIGASQGVVNDFIKRYPDAAQHGKMSTIYNPVYEEKIPVMAAESIADDSFNHLGTKLITVGRLVKQKDQVTLLRAFKILLSTIPDAKLYIIGIGAEEATLLKMASELGITEKVAFLGYKENPYAYVARADLFVLSSEYEGFGNVVVEALATGTNVVSTDCPSGPAEILNNGEFGFLCPVGDAEKMSETIVYALQHKISSGILHNRATSFSKTSVAQQYLQKVKSLFR